MQNNYIDISSHIAKMNGKKTLTDESLLLPLENDVNLDSNIK